MLTSYEQIDDLKPWKGWHPEQRAQLRLRLRSSVDGYVAVKRQMGETLLTDQIESLWRWTMLPALAAQYEVELGEQLTTEGPSRDFGLRLGRMLGNDLKPGIPDLVVAIVQSSAARTFLQLYRDFVSVGELKLTDVL